MHCVIREIIDDYKITLIDRLDGALELRVTNFKRDLFPSLEKIELAIPGAGFQYMIGSNMSPYTLSPAGTDITVLAIKKKEGDLTW
jgi:hypothetical protein